MGKDELIQKYNQPGPRYTSYPPVPFWKIDRWNAADWIETLKKGQRFSLYFLRMPQIYHNQSPGRKPVH